jgi:hypothetical protein
MCIKCTFLSSRSCPLFTGLSLIGMLYIMAVLGNKFQIRITTHLVYLL